MPPPRPISHADMARQAASLMQSGQGKAAERLLKDILRADAKQFDALLTYGVLCGMRGHNADAVKHLTRAISRKPTSDAALYNLGQALIGLGRHAEAIEPLQQAATLVERGQIHEKLGDCQRQLGRLVEAVASFTRAVELDGAASSTMLLSSLIETKRRICDWNGIDELQRRLTSLVEAGQPAEPLLMHYVSDDPALHLRNARGYWQRFLQPMFAQHLPPTPFSHRRPTPAGPELPRVRIGYLCSDFRNHATSHLIAEMIELHDRERLEIIALSLAKSDGSAVRRRLEAAFDRFVDLEVATDAERARRIHGLGIDILVDLNGYIANSRPAILAARPAPVQCHYLAFPGTLGSDVIDYHIVDPRIAPPGDDRYFTERLVRLPDCYQATDRQRMIDTPSPSRATCGLPATGIVLCSFNNAIKITPQIFDVWMRILTAAPECVLWLFAADVATTDRLRGAAETHGVSRDRLIFAGYAPPPQHLARLALADLFLDTFPYSAHTTASDALWVGLPVLTLTGRSFASRVGASLLRAADMPELITASMADYERTAIELATDAPKLEALQARLAAQRDSCRLFDTPRFTRHMDAAYLEMWARHVRGEKPAAFDVATSLDYAADLPLMSRTTIDARERTCRRRPPRLPPSRAAARLQTVAGAGLAMPLLGHFSAAFAAWPERPVKVVVPFAPAGPTDIMARVITAALGEAMGGTFFVENKAGAGGNIGIGDVARSEPDGYTLLLTSSAYVLNPSLYDKVPYDPFKDFEPISEMGASPNVLVVSPSLGIKTLADLVALARKEPEKLNYSSPGAGTTPHLDAERIKLLAGFKMAHVSHNGAGPAIQAILADTVQVACTALPPAHPQIVAGKLIAIAVTGAKRWHDLPNVPTMVELGYKDFVSDTIQALLAPAKTPPEIVARLAKETVAILQKPDIREKLQKAGFEVLAKGPDGLKARIATEVPMWREIVAQTGIKLK